MNYQPYIQRLKVEKEQEGRLASIKRKQALRIAKKISRILKEKFGAEKVYLFGSCLSEEFFHINSDLDIAEIGLSTDDFLLALYEVNTLEADFNVDLVDLSKGETRMAQKILKEGIEL